MDNHEYLNFVSSMRSKCDELTIEQVETLISRLRYDLDVRLMELRDAGKL